MKDTLINLKKGLKGLVVLSEELEDVGNSLYDNIVRLLPYIFRFLRSGLIKASYPSNHYPLGLKICKTELSS